MSSPNKHDFVTLACCGSTFYRGELKRAGMVAGDRDFICPTCEPDFIPCPGCGSLGFDSSPLGPSRCSFCDGTENATPPVQCRRCKEYRQVDFIPQPGAYIVCESCRTCDDRWSCCQTVVPS